MKIIIDTTLTQLKPFSGMGEYVKNLTIKLVKNYSDKFIFILSEEKTTLPDEILTLKNVEIFRYKYNKLLRSSFPLFTTFNRVYSDLFKKYPEAIFFSPYVLNGFPVDKFKVILAIHDFAMSEFNYFSDKGSLMNFIRKSQYWYHMNRTIKSGSIVTASDSAKSDYLKNYPQYDGDNINVIPLGVEIDKDNSVDINTYLPNDYQDKGYFIYMGGGVQLNKNTIGLIKSYAIFKEICIKSGLSNEKVPYLVIAGKIFLNKNNPQMKIINKLISDLCLESNIHFSGFYPDEAKYKLLKESIAFIHLSLYEGFGIAVAEAMSTGVAVIAHNGTSYPEVVGDAGILVNGNDYEECAKAMNSVFNDRVYAKELGLKAKKRSEIFKWENTAKKMHEVFEKLYIESVDD